MKKITLGFSILVAAAVFTVGCNKKTNAEPVADKEFQTSKDAAFANAVVMDVETICSYLGENLLTSSFLTPAPGTPAGSTITAINNTLTNILTVTYVNTVTCRDGKKRSGTILMDISASSTVTGADFYRDAGFVANVTLVNYSVDGWLVDDVSPMKITANHAFGYNPATTPLNWIIEGNFTIDNPADATMSMTWKGKLNKILTNSADATVFAQNKLSPINWVVYTNGVATNGAKVEYKGVDGYVPNVTGLTQVSKGYSLTIKSDFPLKRDFTCAPDKVIGVNSTTTTPITVVPVYSEWHPFVNGTISFTTAGLTEPRLIDFGLEGGAPCDNAGTVTIKGISYPIDFAK